MNTGRSAAIDGSAALVFCPYGLLSCWLSATDVFEFLPLSPKSEVELSWTDIIDAWTCSCCNNKHLPLDGRRIARIKAITFLTFLPSFNALDQYSNEYTAWNHPGHSTLPTEYPISYIWIQMDGCLCLCTSVCVCFCLFIMPTVLRRSQKEDQCEVVTGEENPQPSQGAEWSGRP